MKKRVFALVCVAAMVAGTASLGVAHDRQEASLPASSTAVLPDQAKGVETGTTGESSPRNFQRANRLADTLSGGFGSAAGKPAVRRRQVPVSPYRQPPPVQTGPVFRGGGIR
jgi:hypothetical protein